VQEVLGTQHDAVTRQETLRRLAHQAELDGESTFTYGRCTPWNSGPGRPRQDAAAEAPADARPRLGHRRWMG
jgi:hypothetical protein